MRLRPGQHLRRQSDIRAVRQQGSRVDCKAFTMWWMARAGEPALPRACFVASTQAVGAAVQRNRAKRRMREIFRSHQKLLPRSCDLLLVARSSVNHWPYAQLERTFADACGRIAPPSPGKSA
ncbi:MAG TPA: ribonuclease P protein component [Opitutaceae bacterium]